MSGICFNIYLPYHALQWCADIVGYSQAPVYKEPIFTIPGTPAIVQNEILNNRRHVLTKVNVVLLIFIGFGSKDFVLGFLLLHK